MSEKELLLLEKISQFLSEKFIVTFHKKKSERFSFKYKVFFIDLNYKKYLTYLTLKY
jgi:hypothetical protein